MKLVVLVENHALDPSLKQEHGLSIYVEKAGFHIVYDMGETGLFMKNARQLGIDLSNLDAVAFSHNHCDHCGGFLRYTNMGYKPVPVYVHKGYFRRKWWDHTKDPVDAPTYERGMEFIGPVMSPDYFYQNGYLKFRMLPDDVFELAPDIYLLGNFPIDRENEPPHPSSTMEIDSATYTLDDFRDEQICVIRTKKGLVVLSGCAHNGIMNILTAIEQRFPGEKIHAVFGGTHLVQSEAPRIQKTIDCINAKSIDFVGVCHCTGMAAIDQFRAQIPAFVDVGSGYIWQDS
jgi:7,8-dihydropterin-6-yl-methyl-4-(beta-D-ribofuranosyl)aminobenzene 5'-phosphate synthase